MANCWYAYNGVGDPTQAVSYSLASSLPSCLNGCALCAIFAPNCAAIPASPFSDDLKTAIANALSTCMHQTLNGVTVVAMKAS
ncbi:hypothetical protein [Pedobacter lusitanus]|nr:hypothetical protein [Pedobacter lusitanus]